MSTEDAEQLVISDDGTISMPAIEVLTGRGVIFGKSGSGKSNSASVVIEELLERGFPLLIVDIEGEYYTLKERYEVVHIGATDKADMPLRETEPEEVVKLCLDRNRPVIIDLSEVMDMDPAEYFVDQVITILFSREKEARKPFLVVVEEIHEFLPQQGGLDDLGETLIRIAKRGRKRGLGMAGMSQRPAAVDKEFITQCDWLVWHRLTWKNDTQVVQSILGSEKASEVQELETGQAIMMTDWDETIRTVKFRRKWTYDAADTPTLSPEDRPDLTTGANGSEPAQQAASQAAQESEPAPDEATDTTAVEADTAESPSADSAAVEAATDTDSDDASAEDGETAETEKTASQPATDSTAATPENGGTQAERGPPDRSGNAASTGGRGPDRSPPPQAGSAEPASQGQSRNSVDELQIKSFDPPDQRGSTGTGTPTASPPANRSSSGGGQVTDVPKKHADPPFEDGDSRTALWELGHMISYVVATALAILARSGMYAIEYASGTADGPFDPLEPASADGSGDAPLSRDQMVLILSVMLLLFVLVLGFVVS